MDKHYSNYHSTEQRIEYMMEAMQDIDWPKFATFARKFHIPYDTRATLYFSQSSGTPTT
jgi:hypothetical protein